MDGRDGDLPTKLTNLIIEEFKDLKDDLFRLRFTLAGLLLSLLIVKIIKKYVYFEMNSKTFTIWLWWPKKIINIFGLDWLNKHNLDGIDPIFYSYFPLILLIVVAIIIYLKLPFISDQNEILARFQVKIQRRIFFLLIFLSSFILISFLLKSTIGSGSFDTLRLWPWYIYNPFKNIDDNSLTKYQYYSMLCYFPAFINAATITLIAYISFKFYRRNHPLEYLKCPYKKCGKSLMVYENWQCDYCHNTQINKRYITQKCSFCKRYQKYTFCEHCHKEIKL